MDGRGLLVVFTEGDRVRGLGHVSRCSAYAEGWRRRGGRVQWVLDGDDAAVAMIGEDQPVRLRRWQEPPFETPRDAVEVALVDSYSATRDVLDAIATSVGTAVFIDDLRRDYPPGLVVHAPPDAEDGDASVRTAGSIWLEGPAWQPLRRPFRDAPLRPPVVGEIERVLVVFGGGDLRAIGSAMAQLAAETFPEAKIDLVLGADQPEPDGSANLTCHRALDAAAMASLMCEADVAISAAGQTVSELARCATPTVMVGVAGNQRANLDHWPGLCGFINAGPWDGDDRDERVRDALIALSPAAVRRAIAERAQTVVDGQGVGRLLDRLDQIAGRRTI